MTLYQKLMGCSRRSILTSTAGLALSIPVSGLLAADPASPPKSPVQQQLEEIYRQNGREMPQMTIPSYSQPPQQQQYGGANSPVQPVAGGRRRYSEPAPKKNIFDKLFGVFRKDQAPAAPPQDPGLNYPTASQQQQPFRQNTPPTFVPPPVQGVPQAMPKPVPPATVERSPRAPLVPPAVSPDEQPGLFQAPPSANPIQNPVVNSTPDRHPLADEVPQATATTDTPEAPATETSKTASLPVFDLNAPAEPQATEPVAPVEPQQAAVVPPAPTTMSNDPLANAFPEEPETEADEEITEPYTGLTLEEDLFLKAGPDPSTQESLSNVAAPAPDAATELPSVEASAPPMVAPAPAPEIAEERKPDPVKTAMTNDTAPPEFKAPMTPPELPALEPEDDLPQLPGTGGPQLSLNSTAEKPVTKSKPVDQETQSKLQLIAAREGKTGLKGFCPVVLRDNRDLVDASEEYAAVFNGKRYHFSSQEAMDTFLSDPLKYAPAAGGVDVIHLALTGQELEGSLDHAVWYKGRLYLFNTVETMETFVAAPSSHATDE